MQQIEHLEAMADKWFPFLNSIEEISGVLGTIVEQGATRAVWQHIDGNKESMLMAYPQDSYVRAGAILSGIVEGKLNALSVVPLLEGIGVKLSVVEVYPWKTGCEADICAGNLKEGKGLWFYNPLYFRDKEILQPESEHIFLIAGLCFGLRRAMLDELTITKGADYEVYCKEYLEQNPDKTRLDVPPLKVPLKGVQMISPGQRACEYQGRVTVRELESFMFGPEGAEQKIYSFIVNVGSVESPMPIVLYAPESICLNGYVPEEDHELDLYFWLQGRIEDYDVPTEELKTEK